MTYDQRVDGNALVPTKVAAESKFRRQEHWMVIYDPVVRVSIKRKKRFDDDGMQRFSWGTETF